MWNLEDNISKILERVAEGVKRGDKEVVGENGTVCQKISNMVMGRRNAGNNIKEESTA